ncbi:hypothetical protein OEZ85_002078 [Tetradesmus obliquus]|uniref:Ubiquitin-like protease family profile domain-containing protein n=1 Tax=Tetradesmus obliquus TaxID=3088 RepID=A0ABY8U1U9_TETOB|nr:hypothetical protein OEZ85_002078 [Tetradesmus obliquus]
MQGVSCHFFNSFFMGNLYLFAGTVRYNAVRKWTSPRSLQTAGLIVAPCNLNDSHWTLVVADIDRCRILYLDPMGVLQQGGANRALELAAQVGQ